MGCKTCKDKKRSKRNNQDDVEYENVGSGNPDPVTDDGDVLNLIPEALQNGDFSGNFMFKVIAFIVMTIAIPLIIVVLMGKMFLTFFMPKSLPKVGKRVTKFFLGGIGRYGKFLANKEVRKRKRDRKSVGILNRYSKFRHDKEVRKRKKQFQKNVGYEEVPDSSEYEDDYEDEDEDFVDINIHKDNNEKG